MGLPHKWLYPKCIWTVCFFQYRRADAIGTEQTS